ncbi:MAG TPA: glycosyltransferase, partial [Candidatus Dormibacteraeota bacterium]|nr:glycosyltransferase [Candidatus Dormibacteraeota bacterium]
AVTEAASVPQAAVAPAHVRVTAVVVDDQSGAPLDACITALVEALDGIPSEIVVVDRGGAAGARRFGEAIPSGARVVEPGGNGGCAAGINRAVDAADTRSDVLIVHRDVRLERGAVAALLAALDDPGVGIAVPLLEESDGRLVHTLRRAPTVARAFGEALLGGRRAGRLAWLGEVVVDPGQYGRPCDADWAVGAVMLVSRRCVEAVGPWDETYYLYSDDVDFGLRTGDAGLRVHHVPQARAVMTTGGPEMTPRRRALLLRNRVRLYRRRHGPVSTSVFHGAVILHAALRVLFRRSAPAHRASLRVLFSRPRSETGRTPYVCFAGVDWWYHNRAHSDLQIMRRIAATRPVLVVNSITMRMPLPGRSTKPVRRVLRKLRSILHGLRRPVPELRHFWVLSPLIFPFFGSSAGRRLNGWLVRVQVRVAMRWLGMRDPVVIATLPTAWDVVRRMPRRRLVFNRSDKHSAFGETNQPAIAELEERLLENADLVVYVSRSLMAAEAAHTGDRAVFLDHGVDLDHFRRRGPDEEPDDLRAIPHPRIGFFGAFDDYTVDLGLIELVARRIPEASVVLVGDATCSMSSLESLPNVHWLGFRPYADIPRYGSGFDVALMPWVMNEWIAHCNPIKLKEYLAMGLPVVSTDYPEARPYEPLVQVARDRDEFVLMVERALARGDGVTAHDRRAAVAGASWDVRAAELVALCENAAVENDAGGAA